MASLDTTHHNLPGFNPVHAVVPAPSQLDAADCRYGLLPGQTFIITREPLAV
jgi:hypothetical protein